MKQPQLALPITWTHHAQLVHTAKPHEPPLRVIATIVLPASIALPKLLSQSLALLVHTTTLEVLMLQTHRRALTLAKLALRVISAPTVVWLHL